jgi:thioredoxin 2
MDLNAASFEKHIGRNDIPTMVDFWAPWCGPCKMMGPVFAEAAALLEPQVRLGKINIDVEQAVASRFGVQSVPTVMLFKGGREIARQAGAMNLDSLVRWTQSYL